MSTAIQWPEAEQKVARLAPEVVDGLPVTRSWPTAPVSIDVLFVGLTAVDAPNHPFHESMQAAVGVQMIEILQLKLFPDSQRTASTLTNYDQYSVSLALMCNELLKEKEAIELLHSDHFRRVGYVMIISS